MRNETKWKKRSEAKRNRKRSKNEAKRNEEKKLSETELKSISLENEQGPFLCFWARVVREKEFESKMKRKEKRK